MLGTECCEWSEHIVSWPGPELPPGTFRSGARRRKPAALWQANSDPWAGKGFLVGVGVGLVGWLAGVPALLNRPFNELCSEPASSHPHSYLICKAGEEAGRFVSSGSVFEEVVAAGPVAAAAVAVESACRQCVPGAASRHLWPSSCR